MAGKQVAMLLAIVVIGAISGISSAADHIVGGNTGWTIPSSPSLYSDWAKRQTFKVGDVLVFNFPANQHTVAPVTKANYDSCNTRNTISPAQTNPPANVTLTAGTHYYICTIGTHCTSGQKLAVTVGGSSDSPASAPAPAGGAAAGPSGAATPSGAAGSPAGGAAADTPAGAAEGPSGSSPAGSFATSTGVSLLSLVSVGVAALMF
ncbi:Cucumber peeling cupredoxin [Bienertia sinuspersici]